MSRMYDSMHKFNCDDFPPRMQLWNCGTEVILMPSLWRYTEKNAGRKEHVINIHEQQSMIHNRS